MEDRNQEKIGLLIRQLEDAQQALVMKQAQLDAAWRERDAARQRVSALEMAYHQGEDGRDWLREHLPAKYLGMDLVNAAAEYIQDLLGRD